MHTTPLPSQELLRQLLKYDPSTGKLFWRERTADMFTDGKYSAEWRCNNWNSRYANKEAFTTLNADGYMCGSIFDVQYKAHRVIWKMVYGTEPPEIDHEKGNRSDNRIEKLRASNSSDNSKNQKRPSRNTSGVVGVCWHKRDKKWEAQIRVEGKYIYLGLFVDFDEAVAARKKAEAKYGFHKNHGRV